MTERLADLLHAEADSLEVPYPPVDEILRAGRGERRRPRLLPTLGAVAAAAAVAAVLVVPGLRSDGSASDLSVALQERSSASFSDAQAEAATSAYTRGGAFAVGSKVYLGDRDYAVEIGDPAVRGLYYTSAGVLVRHGKDYTMDGSSRDGYSMVGTDGSVTGLDLRLGDVSPSTDPTQPYLAYARPADGDWEVVLLDLRSGEPAARVPVEGAFTWGGWDAPPVALSGDRVYVALDDVTVAVDWRTGEVTRTALPASTYPDVNADRHLVAGHTVAPGTDELVARARVTDALTGEVLLDLRDIGQNWASLSPDGDHLLVLPSMEVDDDGQIQRLSGAELHSVDTGETMTLPASPQGGYGWTPDGLLFSVTKDAVTLCDADAGDCTTSPLGLDLTADEVGTMRLGGMVNES